MAYRPTWQGHLKLSLVSCPVALYTATNPGGDVHFHLINPKTNNRIRMITTDPDTGPIERGDLVKGYEVAKGEYILLTPDEIGAVKLESTRTIEIERFVPADEIDRLYWDHPYFMAPDGPMAQEAFGVIRAAMELSGQVAIGRVVIGTRERIVALEPRGRGILATTIRADAEVRHADEVFDEISDAAPDKGMIAIAERIIEQREGPFDPGKFVDRYEDALKALIERKVKGHAPAKVDEPEPSNVIDLMAALRASLEGKGKSASDAKGKPAAKASAKPAAKAGAKPKPKPAKAAAAKPKGRKAG